MLEAVFIFAFVSALFELIILMKLSPKVRCRILGNPALITIVHTFVITANLIIHFGTVTGTMTAITAGLASFATVPLARRISGFVRKGVYYPGWKRYPVRLLM